MPKEYINPDTLFRSLDHGFSQGVLAQGRRTLYLSGQVAWNAQHEIVGGDDLRQQAEQAFRNVRIAVEAAGGTLADVVSLRLYIVDYAPEKAAAIGGPLRDAFAGLEKPASTWVGVSALADPRFLIEIEAIAVID